MDGRVAASSPPCVKTNVVSHERTAQLAGALEKQFIRQRVGTILLGGQNIDLPKAQLPSNGMINADIEIERDGHEAPSIK